MTEENSNTDDTVVEAKSDKEQEKQLARKWGKQVMKYRYTMYPRLLLFAMDYLELSSTEHLVLLHIVEAWWEFDRNPYPSVDTLASRVCVNRRQLQNVLRKLEEKGLITRVSRIDSMSNRSSNAYDLTGLRAKLEEFEKHYTESEKLKKAQQNFSELPAFEKGRRLKETAQEKKSDDNNSKNKKGPT